MNLKEKFNQWMKNFCKTQKYLEDEEFFEYMYNASIERRDCI